MATYDVIEAALNSPIDWAVFEKLVADILVQDDVPRIRRAGGYKDSGIDAYETAIYEDESNPKTIVQVTSQRAQTLKVERTLERLKEMSLNPEAIMFVFRHPVASATRADIIRQCKESNVSCDVRDQSYLMLQLGKNTTGLFSRYFESVKSQFAALLSTPDPLGTASDSLRHALLLSVASYVIHPKSRLVRRALFDKTVLAALVSKGSSSTADLLEPIKRLLPEEESISIERVSAALNDLKKSGDCESTEGRWCPSTACLAQFGATMSAVRAAYDDLLRSTIIQCKKVAQGDQATLGYMERNVRRALLKLLRLLGPIDKINETPIFRDESAMPEIRACLSQDLKDDVARHLVINFGAYVEDKANVASLSLFARSYSALSLRNVDPLGRRWQQVALQRSVIALDTDAVLTLLIRELPEHLALRKALDAFMAQGVVIKVSPHIVVEATGHISRAQTTFRKFGEQIERFSPAIVDAKVWHAVVRGFYYARRTGYTGDWNAYWQGYYDSTRAEEYVRYQIGKMGGGKIRIDDMTGLPDAWLEEHEIISSQIVAEKECHRCKAEFRNPEEMAARVRLDIRMAMHLSKETEGESRAAPHGYLISEDRAFFKAERHPCWSPRGRVAMLTRALPQVAEFACGVTLADDEVVRLLFEPATVAAAESVGGDIDTLTALGVNLSDVPLSRLEWALEGDLHKALHQFRHDHLSEARLDSAVGVVSLASARGLTVDSLLTELATKYGEAIKAAEKSTASVETANEMLKRVVLAVAITKKSRRRANRVLKELGLSIADLEKEDESSQQADCSVR